MKRVTPCAGEDVEQGKYSSIAGSSTYLYSHYETQCSSSLERWESIYFKIQLYYSWEILNFSEKGMDLENNRPESEPERHIDISL